MSDQRTTRRISALDRPPTRIRAEDYDDLTSGGPWRPAPGRESSPFVPCYGGSCERCTSRLAPLIAAIAAAAAGPHGHHEDVETTSATTSSSSTRFAAPLTLRCLSVAPASPRRQAKPAASRDARSTNTTADRLRRQAQAAAARTANAAQRVPSAATTDVAAAGPKAWAEACEDLGWLHVDDGDEGSGGDVDDDGESDGDDAEDEGRTRGAERNGPKAK